MPVSTPSTPAETQGSDNLRGMAWMMLSVCSAACMALAVRGASLEMDSRVLVLWRTVFTLVGLLVLIALVTPWRRTLRVTDPVMHLVRGCLMAVSMHLGYYTLANLPLATATVLFFTAPIFATVLAAAFQGERVGVRRFSAVVAGFLGALVILRPGIEPVSLPMMSALGSSLLFAGALTLSRRVAGTDGILSALLTSTAITTVFTVPVAMPVFSLPPSLWIWVLVGTLVLTGTLRNIGDLQAYRLSEAAALAPLAYLRIVIVGIAGFLLFGEVIDLPTLAGAVIIVGSTLYITRREAILRRKARSAPSAVP